MAMRSMIFRKMCEESDAKRDEGLTTPPEIERFDDIKYGSDKQWQVLDVYRPKALSGKLPVIVSFHGGGWVYGDKNVYQFYCMELARRGFAVVNYSYRIAPEYRFPAPFEDTNMVFGWILKNAEQYGFDLDNLFAVGDSAGAMGIALYACICTDKEYAKMYSFTVPEGLKFKGLALNCGIYQTKDAGIIKMLKDFLEKKDYPAILEKLSVVSLVNGSFPPCYIMTSNEDFLREEPKALMESLDKVGVKYRYKLYGDEEHPLGHVFHCNVKSEFAAQANDDECSFFKELMGIK
ncbi:alpha/beta hydrolase [Ruminococcus sp.]|uniref:alpha/beta hydrolase n=1 Tax=Ruminococcus sp. TaxID=41978 RepID=UPI0025E726B1|nr:alpha/beta hydrolase [Ruminococcus sp.]MCR4637699.1 alpha/beta hydrolase [Ruminococcus sp.]